MIKTIINSLSLLIGISLSLQAHASADPIHVIVLDSGIDAQHEIFEDVEIGPGWNFIDENSDVSDDIGHGTHVAGIIAQNSSNVVITSYKVTSKEKTGKTSTTVKALEKAYKEKPDIINISAGFPKDSSALKKIINKIQASGIIVVAAAGNKKSSEPFYPAYYDKVIAVGAKNSLGIRLPNSNYGSWVDVYERGSMVKSSLPGNKYGYKTGTSQAAALVTAKIANCLSHKGSKSLAFSYCKSYGL